MSTATATSRRRRPARPAPRGRVRILLFIVTFGLYGWYWAYKTQEEMRQRTGEGLGGVVGLVIWILISPVSAFVIPSEIGKMYAKDGREPPVTRLDGALAVPVRLPDRHRHPLVREGPGRAQRLLGVGRRVGSEQQCRLEV